jgi:hypothetical protein
MGANSLRCTKILSQCQPFLSFLPNFFLSCKDTFVDDYDGILSCSLNIIFLKFLIIFYSLFFMGIEI